MLPDADVATMDAALWAHRGPAPTMSTAHRHDDLEVNFVFSGRLEYRWAGTRVVVPAGRAALFWGATPHRLADIPRLPDDDMGWVHLPLAIVLRWRLDDHDIAGVLAGSPVVVPLTLVGRDAADLVDRWCRDVEEDAELRAIAMLEFEAVVRRLLRGARTRTEDGEDAHPLPGSDRVAAIARYLAQHFREPVSASDVVEVVHVAPRYAMALFRRASGMTIGAYLTHLRVAEAQRLLITTSLPASEIAHAAGFGSQSSLYTHFGRETGMSPAAYRRSH